MTGNCHQAIQEKKLSQISIWSPQLSGATPKTLLFSNTTKKPKEPPSSIRFSSFPSNGLRSSYQPSSFSKALFDGTKVVANAKQLTALLDDANPFNAVAAARLLAPARGLDAPFISSTLSKSKDYTQAIFTYLTFKNAHPVRQAAIDEALERVIDKAPTSATLKWIALGITTAQGDDAQSYFALKDRAKALLLRVDKRQKALATKTLDDDYVNELLMSAQVRERPVVPPQKTSGF